MARLVRWQTLLAILGILAIGGLLAQLSFTRQVVVLPVRGGSYIEGMVGTPQSLNPLLATSDAERAIAGLLFEGLSSLQPDGSVLPALAEEWATSADGTVYTCTLRGDIRWHDGVPVTTADVMFTLDLIQSPDLPYPNPVVSLWSMVQVQSLDSRRLRFTLERPYAPFLGYTTLPILPVHLLHGVRPAELLSSDFNLRPVGTGPFRLVGIEQGEEGAISLDLQANPYYYRRPPYLETIRFRFYRDEGLLVEALLQGEVDGVFGLSRGSLAPLSQRPGLLLYRTYMQAYTILFLNTQSVLLTDRRVRQAIVMGLDRPALVAGLDQEVFLANGPISPISWAYKPDLPPFAYDPKRAADLLEESGWHDLNDDGIRERDVRPLELTLLTRDLPPEWVTLARQIKEQLAPLGIAIRVVVEQDPESFRREVEGRNFDLLLYGWSQLGRDPDEFALWHSSQIGPEGSNFSSFQSEEADRLLEQGRTALDRDVRTQSYWQFQELFMQQVPAVPFYYPEYTYVLNSRIRGVELSPLNDLGERFRDVTDWYIKTQKVILGRSRPAQHYGDREER